MYLFVILVLSLVPGLLWVWFFYRQDRYDREPPRLILWTFFAGMIAVIPAALLEAPFRGILANPPNLLVRFLIAVFVIGLGEEGVKLLSVYLSAYRRTEFNEAVDGIIYAVTASLGFAAVENVLYTATFGLSVAPIRAIVTSLAHASFGGVAGLHLGLAKTRPNFGAPTVLRGLLFAAGLHGIYDFFIMARLVHPLFAFLLIYVTYRYVSNQIRILGESSPLRRRSRS